MKNIIFCLLLIFAFSCENQELVDPEMPYGNNGNTSACGISNPLEELEWLKEQIEKSENSPSSDYCQVYSVIQGNYKGETVFIPVLSGALCCTCGNTVYNCRGEVVLSCNREEEARIEDKKVIWERN